MDLVNIEAVDEVQPSGAVACQGEAALGVLPRRRVASIVKEPDGCRLEAWGESPAGSKGEDDNPDCP